MTLRQALKRDIPTVVDIWVDAFANDAFLRWIQPDDARWPAFGGAWLTYICKLALVRGHVQISREEDLAVSWIPPDVALVTADDIMRGREILESHAGETRAEDAFYTIMDARAHVIEDSHWTLNYIGVRTSRQGQGLGAAAVTPRLETCDAEGLPCRLVSTNPRNVPFFARLGFAVDAEVPTPDGAVTMRPMHREPATRPLPHRRPPTP